MTREMEHLIREGFNRTGNLSLLCGVGITSDVTRETQRLASQGLSLTGCLSWPCSIGSATVATREKMATMAAANIVACALERSVPFLAKL